MAFIWILPLARVLGGGQVWRSEFWRVGEGKSIHAEFRQLASFRYDVPAQPVDATPSGINLFSKGGVYEI
jgi:hypothetical protein